MAKLNKNYIQLSPMITQAKEQRKGYNLILEILIFILIFIISAIVESIILIVPMFIYIFNDDKIQSLISSGGAYDYSTTYDYIMDRVSNMPDSLFCLSLFATVGIIITVLIYCAKFEKRKLSTLGFIRKNIFSEYGKGLLIGFIMFALVLLLNIITGSVKNIPSGFTVSKLPFLLIILAGFLIQGASEEILCRGYFCVSVACRSSIITSIAVSSIAFGALHLANPGVTIFAVINISLFGIFMAVYMLKRGSLWGVCAIHSIWNFTQGNIFGMSVSGNTKSSSLLTFNNIDGKEIWNGGSFGPEGGLCVTFVLAAALLILIFGCKSKERVKDQVDR